MAIGGIAGWLASLVARRGGYNIIGDIVVGTIGAPSVAALPVS
jgi:uncharacterized membrane protein YeaQ/YmgE (transglycosylase-associated protein family)